MEKTKLNTWSVNIYEELTFHEVKKNFQETIIALIVFPVYSRGMQHFWNSSGLCSHFMVENIKVPTYK